MRVSFKQFSHILLKISILNKDVLLLILEELQDDNKSLYSCLLVNRTWCETTVSILWKIPGSIHLTKKAESILFNVILLHLSVESRDNLRNQGIDLFMETYQPPLFNYISFWKHLNLQNLECMIKNRLKIIDKSLRNDKSKIPIIRNEILNLFINRNTKFISLYIPRAFDHQLHNISGAEHCFSDLEFLQCSERINQNILEGLARISKSIKIMRFNNVFDSLIINNSGFSKLIEAQKNLKDVYFDGYSNMENDKSLEESLIKSANSIQYFDIEWYYRPNMKILSYFANLISLEIGCDTTFENLNYLENVSLPVLKFLRIFGAPSKVVTS